MSRPIHRNPWALGFRSCCTDDRRAPEGCPPQTPGRLINASHHHHPQEGITCRKAQGMATAPGGGGGEGVGVCPCTNATRSTRSPRPLVWGVPFPNRNRHSLLAHPTDGFRSPRGLWIPHKLNPRFPSRFCGPHQRIVPGASSVPMGGSGQPRGGQPNTTPDVISSAWMTSAGATAGVGSMRSPTYGCSRGGVLMDDVRLGTETEEFCREIMNGVQINYCRSYSCCSCSAKKSKKFMLG